MKSLQRILTAACTDRDQPWALATLVRTEGSTYRQPGARLLVAPDGGWIGVLSGGCLEEEVAQRGLEVLRSGEPQRVAFDTRRLYGCAGKLEIFIERIGPAGTTGNLLTEIAARIRAREICRIRVDYESATGCSGLLAEKALIVEKAGTFVQTIPLPVRLLLFGTGPEIPPLRAFAGGLGWVVEEFAHPDEMPADFRIDSKTAAVVMTHHFGRDLTALDRLLPLGLAYLGLLGPKRRHAELLARFQDFRELDAGWLEPVHAPAGLDIGSEAPEEIALSIVSEVSTVLAKRSGGFLREKAQPIHQLEAVSREA